MQSPRLRAMLLAGSALAAAFAPIPLGPLPAFAEPVRIEAPQAPNFADVIDAVSPAVVSVKVEGEFRRGERRGYRFDRRLFEEDEDFLRGRPMFRGDAMGRGQDDDGPARRPRFGMNQGSGFLVSADGYVVTNHHVVENGTKFAVVLADGSELEATLVGADERSNLAVLRVQREQPFVYVAFAEGAVRLGEWVVAVGNPSGLGSAVTAGIVSAQARGDNSDRQDDLLQIDAAVNRGNSGGPVFNLSGQVIGVTNAVLAPNMGHLGTAFAIPASSASAVVKDLIENGRVVRGWLGVQIQPVTRDIAESVNLPGSGGVIVTVPQEGSPAAAVGIRSGDIIVSVNDEKITGPRQLANLVSALRPESKAKISLWRDGAATDVEVTLGALQDAARPDAGADLPAGAARLGLEIAPAEGGAGVLVADVVPGSPAARQGVRPGDVVVSVSGKEIAGPAAFLDQVRAAAEEGKGSVLLQLRRGESVRFIALPVRRG